MNNNFQKQSVQALRRHLSAQSKHDASLEAAIQTQMQSPSNLVKDVAAECGLTLSNFLSHDRLELYYDIFRANHSVGYIAKGWKDPGFRIGDAINIMRGEEEVAYKAHSHEIMRFCATNGIVISIDETTEAMDLQLEGLIYTEGFNRHTFLKTLETVIECVEKAKGFIPRVV